MPKEEFSSFCTVRKIPCLEEIFMFHFIERFLVFSEISCFYLKSGSMESDHGQEGSVTTGKVQ